MTRCFSIGLSAAICWSVASGASAALVAYYPLNGNANEASGINANLNLYGDAGFGPSVHAGLGTALSLDGTGDGAVGPGFVKIANTSMTAVAWANAASLAGDWNSIVKNWGTSAGGQFHFGLGNVAANTLQSIAAGVPTVTLATDFPIDQWVHVAFVIDSVAREHRVYMNGAQVGSAPFTMTQVGLGLGTATITGLGIGHKPNNDGSALDAGGGPGPWNGRLDDVGLFNEALSTAQILQIYQNGLAGIPLSNVPEPSIVWLLLVGVSGGIIRRRQR
jgi:hypothetical protein